MRGFGSSDFGGGVFDDFAGASLGGVAGDDSFTTSGEGGAEGGHLRGRLGIGRLLGPKVRVGTGEG